MFLAHDTLEQAAIRLWRVFQLEPSIALVVAAAYFEWTVSRAIMFLSITPNVELHEKLRKTYGLEKYKDLWKVELSDRAKHRRLPEVVVRWKEVTDAFDARGRLVHGRDRYTKNMAKPVIETLLAACSDVRKYCESHGCDLTDRVPVRRRKSQGN